MQRSPLACARYYDCSLELIEDLSHFYDYTWDKERWPLQGGDLYVTDTAEHQVLIVGNRSSIVRIWDVSRLVPNLVYAFKLPAAAKSVSDLHFCPSSRWLLITSSEQLVFLYRFSMNYQTEPNIFHWCQDGVDRVEAYADHDSDASLSSSSLLEPGMQCVMQCTFSGKVTCSALSSGLNLFSIGDDSGNVFVFNLAQRSFSFQFRYSPPCSPVLDAPPSEPPSVSSLLLTLVSSPSEKVLPVAYAGFSSGVTYCINLISGGVAATIPRKKATAVCSFLIVNSNASPWTPASPMWSDQEEPFSDELGASSALSSPPSSPLPPPHSPPLLSAQAPPPASNVTDDVVPPDTAVPQPAVNMLCESDSSESVPSLHSTMPPPPREPAPPPPSSPGAASSTAVSHSSPVASARKGDEPKPLMSSDSMACDNSPISSRPAGASLSKEDTIPPETHDPAVEEENEESTPLMDEPTTIANGSVIPSQAMEDPLAKEKKYVIIAYEDEVTCHPCFLCVSNACRFAS